MKKAICITPADDEMEIMAVSVSLLNEFKVLGFTTRRSFVEMVMGEKTAYHEYEKMKGLEQFWAGRSRDKFLNADLQIVLDKLKVS